MDNSKASAKAANNFPEVDFSANTKSQPALIKSKLQKIKCYQGICNNGGAFAIAANNFKKMTIIDIFFKFPNTKLQKGYIY